MDVGLLKNVSLFEGLTHAQIQKIVDISTAERFEGSAPIFREGDPAHAMYVVAEGRVRISKTIPGIGEEALAILEKGQFFGEMALIEEGARSADAIAHIPCKLVTIRRDKLEQLLFVDKDLAYLVLWSFVRTLSARLRETSDKIKGFFAISKF